MCFNYHAKTFLRKNANGFACTQKRTKADENVNCGFPQVYAKQCILQLYDKNTYVTIPKCFGLRCTYAKTDESG